MKRASQLAIVTLFSSALCAAPVAAQSSGAATTTPKDLRDCYMRVALQKTSADMAYLARQLCDAVFAPAHRSLVVLEPKSKACVEWWLDGHNRYESSTVYCDFHSGADAHFSLACQSKEDSGQYSLVELVARGERYERVGEPLGYDPGQLFQTLAACLRFKAGK